ncbi:MAG: hypothetical protein AB8H86_31000 [Polyangiales bacterium]
MGHRTQVRAIRRADGSVLNTFETTSGGTLTCLQGSTNWSNFLTNCTSHSNGALGLQTSNFVPNVTVGRVDCSHTGQNACSPCGIDLASTSPTSPGELYQPNLDIEHPDDGYRLESGTMIGIHTGIGGHTQGVARLRDLIVSYNTNGTQDRVGRVIHTDNAFDSGLTYYEQNATTGICGLWDTVYYTTVDPQRQYRQNLRADYGHPGGAQAHGDYVVVALEDYGKDTETDWSAYALNLPPGVTPAADGAAVYFLHYAPTPGSIGTVASVLLLDGSQGEPEQTGATRAAAASFVQLADHHFLLAVAGGDHIWFYYSDRTTIDLDTQWKFISFWSPDDTTHPYEPDCLDNADGDNLDDCYGASGGLGGMALMTDCSGAIYLVTMNGSSGIAGDQYQYWQVWRLLQHSSGAVQLFQNSWQRDYTGVSQTNNPAFRWSGGAYMSTLKRPVLFNTERGTNEGDNQLIDGHLYYRIDACGGRSSEPAFESRGPLSDPDSGFDQRVPSEMRVGGAPMRDQQVLREREVAR